MLADMDVVMLDADFIGVVRVDKVADDNGEVDLSVEDAWVSRWPDAHRFAFNQQIQNSSLNRALHRGQRLVVWISGGAWVESPFTYRPCSTTARAVVSWRPSASVSDATPSPAGSRTMAKTNRRYSRVR